MFKPTLASLDKEIMEAERLRDDHLSGINKLIREFSGRWYRGSKEWSQYGQGFDDGEYNPDPFSYSFISNMLPALISANPSVIVKARRVIGHRRISEAMQSGLRSWIRDVDYKKELERVVLDFLFFQGVLLHFIEDDTRWSDGAVRPNSKRIPFQCFGGDSLASSIEEAEFLFHHYYADVDDLLADPAILPEAVARLQARSYGSANDAYTSKAAKEPFLKGDEAMVGRKRVCLYSVWSRRDNTIRVVTRQPQQLEIYPEREYYGPPTGPYTVFQAYPVPGQFYPLSPLVAVEDQVMDLQVHARAASRGAAGRKSLIICDGALSNLAEDVKHSQDREVLAVNGFSTSSATQFELGGVTPQQYEYLGYLRQRLDRHSGMTETARGQTSNATATADSIANEALNNRTEYLKSKVRDSAAKALRTIGWFMFHTPGIIIPVSTQDPTTGMEGEGLFFGGPVEGMESGTWDDYSLEIEPLSMQNVSEAVVQRRALDFASFITQTAPLIPQVPWVRWVELIKMVGDAMNQENAESFLIPEMLGMMSSPDMGLVSQSMGQPPDGPGASFSMPGMGFKGRQAEENSNASPAVDDMRSQFGQETGALGGGLQGPPGSKPAPGRMVPRRMAG